MRPGNSLYDDVKYVDENFGGMLPLEIVITSPDSNIFSVDFLKKAELFEQKLRSLDEIKKTMSLVDHLKVINDALNPETGMIIPLTSEEIEDYLYDYDCDSDFDNAYDYAHDYYDERDGDCDAYEDYDYEYYDDYS